MATSGVSIYEHPSFGGRTKTLGVGVYRSLASANFSGAIASIRVPSGLGAILFEHADKNGGYGISVDLLEDCPDLSKIGFSVAISYLHVFSTDVPLFQWARGAVQNGQYLAGHWERQRTGGPLPASAPVVSPPNPPSSATVATAIHANGAESVITALGPQDLSDSSGWTYATDNQAGILGNDFRGVDEIGSGPFERGSNNMFIPDWINFWFPQKRPNDHRTIVYYKHTLAGQLKDVHIARIDGTYEDHDLNIDIVPDDPYRYLLTESHAREYTDIMWTQWNGSLWQSGQSSCDDAASIDEFTFIEAEVQVEGDTHGAAAQRMNDLLLLHQSTVCVYGPWIYDRGHCCHAEIHPAEQIWFRHDLPNGIKRYSLNVICDASQRFWWRDQIDNAGTKLRPWAAPPVRGLFAIAFEVGLNFASPGLIFEVEDVDAKNVNANPGSNRTSSLTYKGKTLVQFIPHNEAFRVSFENVGLHGDTLRGFLVIETSVGSTRQKATQAMDYAASPPRLVQFPVGQDPDRIDQRFERQIFEKVEGHYLFQVTQTNTPDPDNQELIKTVMDLSGKWTVAGAPGPVVSVHGNSIVVDMSAYHRPLASGVVLGASDISVTFPDDRAYTGKLLLPNRIQWSNNSVWTKV